MTRKGSYTLNVFKTFLIFKGGLPIFLIKNILGVNSFIIIVIARILASVKCRT